MLESQTDEVEPGRICSDAPVVTRKPVAPEDRELDPAVVGLGVWRIAAVVEVDVAA